MEYDVVIIGGGVVGCAIARSLSKYTLDTILLEKEEDLCSGTSKANSGIVHSGYDPKPGTLMAQLNIEGNALIHTLSKELDFDFKENGSLIICREKEHLDQLKTLYNRGIANGVKGLEILQKEQVMQLEPNLNNDVVGALLCKTGGIVDPFGMTYAFAENAFANGVKFQCNTPVISVEKLKNGYLISCQNGKKFQTKYVVNAAGLYSDVIHNEVSQHQLHITPRRGNYMLFDKAIGNMVSHTIFQLPTQKGKGVLVTPTIHNNMMIGPTSVHMQDREDTSTTAEDLALIKELAQKSVTAIPFQSVITSFSGLRAAEDGKDFVIGEVEDSKGFFDAAGIKSPGLSCSPAIAEHLAKALVAKAHAQKKPHFIKTRQGQVRTKDLDPTAYNALIKKNPLYGKIVCRCEQISEGEIIDAIQRPLGATSLDGIKRRCRAGSGRCQAGFCTARTMEILSEQTGIPLEQITKNAEGSELLKGEIK